VKKVFALVLALLLALGAASSALADLGRTVDPFEGDPPTISFGFINQTRYDADSLRWPAEIFNYIREYMNVDLSFINTGDANQNTVMFAGGDLPDMLMVDKLNLSQVIQAGLMVAMDDFLDGTVHMKSLSPLREAIMREFNSMGDGKWYFWTPQVGPATKDPYQWNGYTVRWDQYKELGAPEIVGMDGYIDYIKMAVESKPTTDGGKKVWGYGVWNDLWAYFIPGSVYNGGYTNITSQYHLNYVDSSVVNGFVDDNGPIWPSIEFCFKLNQLGLFDPDSFTMTGDDYRAKIADEQYVAIACQWYDALYPIKRLEDPESIAGYTVLPVVGNALWSGSIEYAGWNFYYGITTSCADPTVAMRIFDFMNSPEGARIMMTGDQGRIWDYNSDGTPVVLEEAIDNRASMNDDEWGIWGQGVWNGVPGVSGGTMLSDGGLANLWYGRDILIRNMRPLDRDFAAFYGVELPHDVSDQMVKNGEATDQSVYMRALVALLGTPPTEIQRIDNSSTEVFIRNLSTLILAADPGEFENLKAALLDELFAGGIQDSMDWWFEQADIGRAFVEANM